MTSQLTNTRCYGPTGLPVALARELGRGGEGTVFDLANDPKLVAKLYHKGVSPQQAAKLDVMCRHASPELTKFAAWPVGTLKESPTGRTIGFLQPRVTGREIHDLYGFKSREQLFANANWKFLIHTAMNLAAAVESIHSHGHVVGDVNSKNVWVTPHATISLVDCDSFQIIDGANKYLCEVGVEMYTPPELQGTPFRGVIRSPNHDCFGLSVLIFQLLFVGRHPFIGVPLGRDDIPVEKAISEFKFAFSRHAQGYGVQPPPFTPALDCLPTSISNMFERAFDRSGVGSGRPTAAQWREALATFEQQLKTCSADKGHSYYERLQKCPWCEILHRGGSNYFRSVAVVQEVSEIFRVSLGEIENAVRSVDALVPPPVRFAKPPPKTLPAKPYPEELLESLSAQRTLGRLIFLPGGLSILSPLLVAWDMAFALALAGFFLLVTLGFVGAWAMCRFRSRLGKERHSRIVTVSEWQGEFQKVTQQREQQYRKLDTEMKDIRQRLQTDRRKLDELQPAFNKELRDLENSRQRIQFEAFLDRHLIASARISGVGKAKTAALTSFGIETALDVTPEAISRVPGFGPVKTQGMLAWRLEIERQFRFDPSQRISAAEIQKLTTKYALQQKLLRDQIVQNTEYLFSKHRAWSAGMSELDHQLNWISTSLDQAVVDAEAPLV